MISALYILDKYKHLKESLESVKDFCSEIICVIDSRCDCQEEIKVICEQYTNEIYYHDWADNNYSTVRNFAKDQCHGDWWFVIDADEVLEQFETPDYEYDFYPAIIINRTPDGDRMYPSFRLAKNGLGIKYTKESHETFEESLIKDGELIRKQGIMKLVIRHHGYEDIDMDKKTLGLLQRHLRQLQTEPENHSLRFQIAKCYYRLKQYELCRDMAMQALVTPMAGFNKAHACIYIYLSYKELGSESMGLFWLELSTKILKQQTAAHYLLYNFYLRIKDKEKQIEYLTNIKQTFITGTMLPNDIQVEQGDIDNRLKELNNGL